YPLYRVIDFFNLRIQTPCFRGRMQSVARPLKKRVAKSAFRQSKHSTDSRLRYVQCTAGVADRAGHHDGAKDFDLAQTQRWASIPGVGTHIVRKIVIFHTASSLYR